MRHTLNIRHRRGIKAIGSQAGCEVIKKKVNAGQGIEGFRDAEDVGLKRQSSTRGHLAMQDAHLFRSSSIGK